MTRDPEDILLDACLDEVLGGRTPPDLTARIMRAWSAVPDQDAQWEPEPPPIASPPVVLASPPVAISPPTSASIIAHGGSFHPPGRTSNWLAAVAAVALIAVGIPLGVIAVRSWSKPGEVARAKQREARPKDDRGLKERAAKTSSDHRDQPDNDAVAEKIDSGFRMKPQFGAGNGDSAQSSVSQPRVKAQAEPDEQVIAFVNRALEQVWTDKGVKPAPPATDAEWCRRTYLRLIGRIPTIEELKQFTADKSADRKSALIEQLTSADSYRDEFARHWAEFFAGVLIGRGNNASGPASREGLLEYLRQAIHSGKSYDRMAFDLLTATGSGQPGSSDYNGAANFLLANLNDKGVLATSRTSRVFLGKQLQCAQCHHHPTNEWGQHHFWELNAFFRQTQAERDQSGQIKLVNHDFRGERGDPTEAEVYYEVPSGQMKVAYPAFPGSPPLSHSGLVSEVDRRAELAKRVLASEELSRAAVNRLWSHFLGYGFTRPIDDMGPHNPPSHPELLDRLAEQFAAHDYSLPTLMRWIVLSEAFGVSSKVGGDMLADAPEAGESPLFSRYYTRQMQPEQVFESLRIVATARKNGGGAGELAKARLAWLGQFTREMGTDDGEEQNSFNGDIRQSIIMMNGPLTQRAISHEQGSMLDRVAQSKLSFDEKVEHLFLAAVARKPDKREFDLAAGIQKNRTDAASALQDIWWALLNSNEFILDH